MAKGSYFSSCTVTSSSLFAAHAPSFDKKAPEVGYRLFCLPKGILLNYSEIFPSWLLVGLCYLRSSWLISVKLKVCSSVASTFQSQWLRGSPASCKLFTSSQSLPRTSLIINHSHITSSLNNLHYYTGYSSGQCSGNQFLEKGGGSQS